MNVLGFAHSVNFRRPFWSSAQQSAVWPPNRAPYRRNGVENDFRPSPVDRSSEGGNRPAERGFRGPRRESFVPKHGIRNSTDVLRPRIGRSGTETNRSCIETTGSDKGPHLIGRNAHLLSFSSSRRDWTVSIRSISRGSVEISGFRCATCSTAPPNENPSRQQRYAMATDGDRPTPALQKR